MERRTTMPGFPQLPCPVSGTVMLGFDLVDLAVNPLIASRNPPPPLAPTQFTFTVTFRAGGGLYHFFRILECPLQLDLLARA